MAKDEFESQDARDDVGIFIHSELDDYGLNPLEFRVYGRLARRAGKKGKSRQSVPHMAEEFGVHKRSVQRALRLLVICGLADGQVRLGKPTVYTLNPRRKWKDRKHLASIREYCRNSKGATPEAWVQDFDGSAPASPGVRHQEPGGATPQPHEGTPSKVLPEGTPDPPMSPKGNPPDSYKPKEPLFGIEELEDSSALDGIEEQMSAFGLDFVHVYRQWWLKYFRLGGIGRRSGSKSTAKQYAASLEGYFGTWARNETAREHSKSNGNGHRPNEIKEGDVIQDDGGDVYFTAGPDGTPMYNFRTAEAFALHYGYDVEKVKAKWN